MTTSSATPSTSTPAAPTTTEVSPELGDPSLLAGEWLVTYTGVEQYPEQLFFYWQPGDRWGLWQWDLTPTCPEVGCSVALTTSNLLYGPGEESFDIGEFVYADGMWALTRSQDFGGGCLPSDAADWANDDYWHLDAFTGSEVALTVTPSDVEPAGGSFRAASLEVTRVETGIFTEDAAAVCDVPVFSRSVASAVPFDPEAVSILPEPSAPQRDVLAVAHEADDGGIAISLFDVSTQDYVGVGADTDLGVVIEDGRFPEWSPDGTLLAYTVYAEGAAPEVWVASGDGSDPRFLAVGYEPIWSPDGNMILVRRDGERTGWTDLYMVFLPGGQVEQAVFRGWSGDAFFLEPDRVAVNDPAQFVYWTMRRDDPYVGFESDSEEPLLVGAVGEAHRAADRIFYTAVNESSPRLAIANLTGAEQSRFFLQPVRPDAEWAVSPDGSLLAVPTSRDLHLVTVVAGGDLHTYVNQRYSKPHSVAWSPGS